MPWQCHGQMQGAAHLLAIRRMTTVKVGNDHEEGYNTNQDGFVMHTTKVETLEPFSSHVIPVKTMEAYLGERLNVMVQALYVQDGTLLPGLTMQNTYTELRKGSKKAVVVVWNHTAYPKLFGRRLQWQGNTRTVITQTPQAWESTGSRQSVSRSPNSKVND